MLEEGHAQNGQDVELVRREVVMQQVVLPTICHQQAIAENNN